MQPLLASYISSGVGYCFIHSNGNAKTRVWDKTIEFPHLLFYNPLTSGNWGAKNICYMCSNCIVDAKFALLLIQSLKEMLKSNGQPFIRNGVTLPFLAYSYKRLNCDDSPITEDYIQKIINSLDNAKDIKFIYQHCSEINEDVISQQTKMEERLEEQGYYTRSSELTMLYDPQAFEQAPSSQELYKKYNEIMFNKAFSRVWNKDECKYDWDVISEEENIAINKIINDYKSKLNNK